MRQIQCVVVKYGYIEKDDPQPQPDVALGFLMMKSDPLMLFMKSTVAPASMSSDMSSVMIVLENKISSSCFIVSSQSNRY